MFCLVEQQLDGYHMLEIVYEDNHLLVVVKPPNVLTQGDKTGDCSLLDYAKRYIKEKYNKPGEAYVGLVHRLDRPVGGLVVFAKTSKAASRLSEQLRTHKMAREYLAVVENATIAETQTIKNAIIKDDVTGNVKVVSIDTQAAQQAELNYNLLQSDAVSNTALIAVKLKTGRKHQIRVQMANTGHPFLYDMRYGHGVKGKSIALFGAVLRLVHPTTKENMTFTAKPTVDAFAQYQTLINVFLEKCKEV